MSGQLEQLGPHETARRLRIIGLALISGCVSFGGIAVFVSTGKQADPPIVAWIGSGLALLLLVISRVVPNVVGRNQVRQVLQTHDAESPTRTPALCQAFSVRAIIAMALVDGAGFFNIIAYMIDQTTWSLWIVLGLLFVIVMEIPSAGRIETWLSDQERMARDQF